MVDALENVNAYKDKEKNVIPLLIVFISILLPKCFSVSACIILKNGVILYTHFGRFFEKFFSKGLLGFLHASLGSLETWFFIQR